MNGLKSAVTKNAQQLPIVQYEWQSGIRMQATSASPSFSEPLNEGAFLVVASAPVWLSIGLPAGDAAGSIYLSAGLPFHVLTAGGSVSALAVDAPSTVSIIPIS